MSNRRKATKQELEQGEREMRAAQRRMEREAETSGELALEDQGREVETGLQRSNQAGQVTLPPIQDAWSEEGSATEAARTPMIEGPVHAVPKGSPVVLTPVRSGSEYLGGQNSVERERMALGAWVPVPSSEVPRTPLTNQGGSQILGEGTAGKASTASKAEVQSQRTPLFTEEQQQYMAQLQMQAPLLYGNPKSTLSPFVGGNGFPVQDDLKDTSIPRIEFERQTVEFQVRLYRE